MFVCDLTIASMMAEIRDILDRCDLLRPSVIDPVCDKFERMESEMDSAPYPRWCFGE